MRRWQFLPIGLLVLGLLVLLVSGCASLRNTPQQDYVYDMARPCEANGVQISYVAPDGKTWRGHWAGGAYTWPEFQQCVGERMRVMPYQKWMQQNASKN